MNTIDLHMHSIFSIDGTYQPEELYAMCKKQGIRYMAIADHNSVRGSRKLLDVKKEDDPAVVPAIELDCTCEGKDFHLLGYGIDVKDPVYEKIENDFCLRKFRMGKQGLHIQEKK